MTRILAVIPDPDLHETVEETLQKELGADVQVDAVRNEAAARARLMKGVYDLLITDPEVAADRTKPLDLTEHRGLALARDFRVKEPDHGIIFVPSVSTPELHEDAQNLQPCWVVALTRDRWAERLVDACQRALQQKQTHPVPSLGATATLELGLDLKARRWTWGLHGSGVPYEEAGELAVRDDEMQALVDQSQMLAGIAPKANDAGVLDTWHNTLQGIGKRLFQELFARNGKLTFHLGALVEKVGGLENCRLRFVVEQTIHPAVLEAVMSMPDGEKYWMLEGPIVRRLAVASNAYPLFVDADTREGAIDVLIIEANASGLARFGERESEDLPALAHVKNEADTLESYLRQNQAALRIGRIERLATPAEGRDFAGTVRDALQTRGPWHVVHYAGHSIYKNGPKPEGYIVLPEPADASGLVVVPLEDFSQWLRQAKVRFVYLSSCESSKDAFVFEMARAGVPAVLGFRWKIDDRMAAKHADQLYRQLLQPRRSLESAFLETRRAIYKADTRNPTWAASVLIMQVSQ